MPAAQERKAAGRPGQRKRECLAQQKGRTGVTERKVVKLGCKLGGSQGRRALREGEARRMRMSQVWKERGISM